MKSDIEKKQNEFSVLRKDADLLEFYFERKKWFLLDCKINEIIKSDDVNRMKMVLVLLKSQKDNPLFKETLNKISDIIEKKLGSKVF